MSAHAGETLHWKISGNVNDTDTFPPYPFLKNVIFRHEFVHEFMREFACEFVDKFRIRGQISCTNLSTKFVWIVCTKNWLCYEWPVLYVRKSKIFFPQTQSSHIFLKLYTVVLELMKNSHCLHFCDSSNHLIIVKVLLPNGINTIRPNDFWFRFSELIIWINLDSLHRTKSKIQTSFLAWHSKDKNYLIRELSKYLTVFLSMGFSRPENYSWPSD